MPKSSLPETEDNLVKQTLHMYVNSSLTAQRIHICTGLRFFWIRDSTHHNLWLREKFSLGIFVQLEVSLDFKRCSLDADLCLSLKFFRRGSWNSIRVTAPSVENSVLLKCRKLRREDQEKSDWIVSRILFIENPSCW